jgi:hypothetical protein
MHEPDQQDRPNIVEPRGSLFTTVYTERKVKTYAVVDTELDNLSMLNSETVVFSSVGTGLVGYASDCLRDAFTKSPHGDLKLAFTFISLSLLCYGMAGWRFWKRRTLIQSIKAQSQSGQL